MRQRKMKKMLMKIEQRVSSDDRSLRLERAAWNSRDTHTNNDELMMIAREVQAEEDLFYLLSVVQMQCFSLEE